MTAVGTEPVNFGTNSQLIQNLGPDEIYVGVYNAYYDDSDLPTSGTGVKVSAGESLAASGVSGDVYCVSAGTSDVRSLAGGSGIFPAPVAPTP